MKRLFVFVFIIPFISTAQQAVSADRQANKLSFRKGEVFEITSDIKNILTQEVMGKSVNITTTGQIIHSYEVKKHNDGNTTFTHKIKRIWVGITGMGEEKLIDTDKPETDAALQSYLKRSYEFTIDASGKIISASEKKSKAEEDVPPLLNKILGETIERIDIPQTGERIFLKVLPDKEIKRNDAWNDSITWNNTKQNVSYVVKNITDTEINIEYAGPVQVDINSEVSGQETTTNLNGDCTGQIIIDRKTGIIKRQTRVIQSNGNAVAMGQKIPLKSVTVSEMMIKSQ